MALMNAINSLIISYYFVLLYILLLLNDYAITAERKKYFVFQFINGTNIFIQDRKQIIYIFVTNNEFHSTITLLGLELLLISIQLYLKNI